MVPTVRPEHKYKIIWDLFIVIIIMCYFFIIPMQLSFDMFYHDELVDFFKNEEVSYKLANFLILLPEIMLIVDTSLKFITGFYQDGVVITEKWLIIEHYLRKGLIFDLLSYMPIIYEDWVKRNFPSLKIALKFVQLLMFFKVKRVNTAITNYEEMVASKGKNDFFFIFCKMFFVIIFITHLNACIWHAIAYFYPLDSCCTWLDYSGLKDSHWIVRYIYSFYWAISMMATIGFGERVSPRNSLECIIGVFILIISVLLFGYCINSMKQSLDLISKQDQEYK